MNTGSANDAKQLANDALAPTSATLASVSNKDNGPPGDDYEEIREQVSS